MPRKIRVQYPGAIYHVMSRANGKGNIFHCDVDRQDFLKTLAEACQKAGFEIHAYCLMRNHFHLVIETPNANLGRRSSRPSSWSRWKANWASTIRGKCAGRVPKPKRTGS